MGRSLALAVAMAAAVAPAPAHAGGSVTPVPAPPHWEIPAPRAAAAGPLFAGGLAAVAQSESGELEVWGVAGGKRRVLGRVPGGGGTLGFAASDRLWVVSSYAVAGDCAHGVGCRTKLDRVDSGPLGGAPDLSVVGCDDRDRPCPSVSGCRRGVFDASGDVLAYKGTADDPCARATVVDRANPADRIEIDSLRVRVAGRYVAYVAKGVHVYDRVARAESYTLPTVGSFDVQEDGTTAFQDPDGRLAWASPADPAAHEIPGGPPASSPAADVRLAGDRVAVASSIDRYRGGLEFSVLDFAGRRLAATSQPQALPGWDFDGSRLTWMTLPCTSGQVAIWDLTGEPPEPARGRCPLGRVSRAAKSLDERGAFRIGVECPRSASLGCAGGVHLSATPRGRSKPVYLLGESSYRVHSGDSGRMRIRLTKDARRFVSGRGTVSVRALIDGVRRAGGGAAARGGVRFDLRG